MTVVERIEQASGLDPVSDRLQRLVSGLPRPVRDLLHGVWLGHPLHPAMVHAPVGAWMSAAILDLIPGQHLSYKQGAGVNQAVPDQPCVVCPWHGSTFRLADGGVVHGPAATDQPTLLTRVVDGRLQACRP